jgi:hypothetical protein
MSIIEPGQRILFMKVGTHAQEPLEEIIERKTKEIEDAGYALWGYGGSTCHPQMVVQPFAKAYEELGGVIFLCMEPMTSKHYAPPLRANEYSVDAIEWKQIPPEVNARGSRYALFIKNLRREDFQLPLSRTRVALGNKMGAIGSRYVRGRVDKACLEVTDKDDPKNEHIVQIGLVAELVEPYAVYLRNRAA